MIVFYFFFMRRTAKIASATEKMKPAAAISGMPFAVVGLSAAPFAVLSTALVSFGLDCELEVEKKDGSVINLNETPVGEKLEGVKDAVEAKVKELVGKDAADPPAENA